VAQKIDAGAGLTFKVLFKVLDDALEHIGDGKRGADADEVLGHIAGNSERSKRVWLAREKTELPSMTSFHIPKQIIMPVSGHRTFLLGRVRVCE